VQRRSIAFSANAVIAIAIICRWNFSRIFLESEQKKITAKKSKLDTARLTRS